jgi:hypothetical protein
MENAAQTLEHQAPSKEAGDSSSSWDEDVLNDGDGKEQVDSKDTGEPLDNKERSRLGRRLSKFEEDFGSIKNQMTRLEQMLMEREQPRYAPPVQDEEEEDPDRILTLKDLKQLQAKEQRQEQDRIVRYQGDYIKTVKSLYTEDPDNHALIEKELLTNTADYPTWSNRKDAKADAIANYWKARAKVLEAKYKTASPNVRGGNPSGAGVTTSTRQSTSEPKKEKLDDVAAKMAKAFGMEADYE